MRLDLTLLALAAPLVVLGDLRHSHRRTHNHHGVQVSKHTNDTVSLDKRSTFTGARWTFYDVGGAAGACGKFNTPDQHIVALNSAQYGSGYPGPQCWKTIVMQIGGKQTTATITDECPGCPYGGLDLTRGLFSFFDDLDVGVLSGTWWFADDAPDNTQPTTTHKAAKPTTTWQPPPKPTTTHHTTTSTKKSTSSTSTHSSTHSSSASSSAASVTLSINPSDIIASGLAMPTSAISGDNDQAQNILACNELLVGMGGLMNAAVARA